MAVPTHTMAENPIARHDVPILSKSFVDQTPLSKTPNLEKLRAYHAALDRWNMIHDPEFEDETWHISKILKEHYSEFSEEIEEVVFSSDHPYWTDVRQQLIDLQRNRDLILGIHL